MAPASDGIERIGCPARSQCVLFLDLVTLNPLTPRQFARLSRRKEAATHDPAGDVNDDQLSCWGRVAVPVTVRGGRERPEKRWQSDHRPVGSKKSSASDVHGVVKRFRWGSRQSVEWNMRALGVQNVHGLFPGADRSSETLRLDLLLRPVRRVWCFRPFSADRTRRGPGPMARPEANSIGRVVFSIPSEPDHSCRTISTRSMRGRKTS